MRAIDSSLVICALGAGQAQASYQQVRKFGGQCLRRSLGLPAIWLHAVARTRPEGRFVDIQLIAENMAPDVGSTVPELDDVAVALRAGCYVRRLLDNCLTGAYPGDMATSQVAFRPTEEDRRIIESAKRPDEGVTDVIRRALRLLAREDWLRQAREDAERLADEDLSAEQDAW
jgi:antitoxin ParD1/3/4